MQSLRCFVCETVFSSEASLYCLLLAHSAYSARKVCKGKIEIEMLSISAIVVIAYIALLQLVVFTIVNSSSSSSSTSTSASVHSILKIRGGLVPQASDSNGGNYYEQYTLDYGSSDNKRMAGALRGFIRTGSISSSPEADPFFKWLNNHLETGSEAITGRLKPFYVSDTIYIPFHFLVTTFSHNMLSVNEIYTHKYRLQTSVASQT